MLVKDIMTPDPICVAPAMPVTEAQSLLRSKEIRHLPVVDEEKRLVGLVTRGGLISALPSDTDGFSRFEVSYVLARTKVGDIMVRELVTTEEDMAIEEAARIMADEKIGCLPVMRDGDLVGIITDNDLFNSMANLLGSRRAGLRVTVSQPDRSGEVARISTAIARHGGYLSVFVTYPTANPGVWQSVLKVNNMSQEEVLAALESVGEVKIEDVRQGQI
jgi:acetoin utilization protein AcuB